MNRAARLQPYLLMAVFLGPLLLAAVAYFAGWRSSAAPHGELLDTPAPLPELALTTSSGTLTSQDLLQRRWSLIYVAQAQCNLDCVEQLNRINQVRLALGKDMGRAQVVLLYTGPAPRLPDRADVILVSLDDSAGRAMGEFFATSTAGDREIFVTDPLGRLVIAYGPDVARRELLEDIERLLAVL
ncbi:MAG TPA: hypothetical protein VKQ06_05175 [Gammaproteobacteria bacterium]|nr:hypothetical protein [Gammaproteobacteria bacterium]